MNALLRWLLKVLDVQPVDLRPVPRRRARARCEFCGKDLAVVKRTGEVWRHRCDRPAEKVVRL